MIPHAKVFAQIPRFLQDPSHGERRVGQAAGVLVTPASRNCKKLHASCESLHRDNVKRLSDRNAKTNNLNGYSEACCQERHLAARPLQSCHRLPLDESCDADSLFSRTVRM